MRKLFIFTAFTLLLSLNSYAYNIKGTVIDSETKKPLESVTIKIEESKLTTKTDSDGNFKFNNLDNGEYTLINGNGNYEKFSKSVELNNADVIINIELSDKEYKAGDVVVYGVSKRLEKITESPAAVSVKYKEEIERSARSGQLAKIFDGKAGIDIMQSGSSDFIVNTRGFNNGLNRRLLVLQDGRDASMPLLGAQEWNSFSTPLEDFSRVELVRGPSASLYGANAFNGVLNLTSYAPKDIIGTKISILGGENETYKADIRHAGVWGDFGYKVSMGYSHKLNYAHRRDSVQFFEYNMPNQLKEKKVMTADDRNTNSAYGTVRFDYDFDDEKTISSEFGYSKSSGEIYVFGLGRTLVKEVERPYLRLAYNSSNWNIHFHYMNRNASDTMWLMVPGAPLLDNSKDFMLDVQYNFNINNNISVVWGISEQLQKIRTYGTSIPNDVDADYTGVYGQLEWKLSDMFKFVGSARYDHASIHNAQFSPRVSAVYAPVPEHQFRLSFGRAFQRPNYSELYRVTADAPAFASTGAPVNFTNIQKSINDSLTALSGTTQNINLGLAGMKAYAIGNKDLKVESIIGYEIGYKGILFNDLYITCDIYYNKINDFITNFLPGVNSNIQAWSPNLSGDLAQYNDLVKQMVYHNLNAKDQARLSDYNGIPALVISNTNIGEVEQYGLELEVNYNMSQNISCNANYAYYDFKVVESNKAQPLLPNTSPNRFNVSMTYQEKKCYDASLSFNYTEGYRWLAGTYEGYVPSYAILNLNAGVYLTDNLHLGLNVFNILNRQFYQVYGGTYLPRYTTIRLSWQC